LCNLRSKKFKTLTYSRLGEITRGPVSQAARNQGYTKQSTINNSKQNSPTPAKDRHSRNVFDLGVNDKTLQTLQTLQCCDTTTITIGHTSSAAASGKLPVGNRRDSRAAAVAAAGVGSKRPRHKTPPMKMPSE